MALAAGALTVSDWTLIGGGALLALYAVVAVVFDRCLSTRPSRNLLVQTLEGLRDCAGWPRPDAADAADAWDRVRDEANAAIDRGQLVLQSPRQRKAAGTPRTEYALFIESSRVLAVWREAHRIERLCWTVAPTASRTQRLTTARAEIAAIEGSEATALGSRIAAFLDAAPTPPKPANAGDWLYRKVFPTPAAPPADAGPLLHEALVFVQNDRDTKYESLADRQTKGSWFTVLGAALVVIAACTFHRESILLFGALGGFLSRVFRLLRRSPGAMDYGVSAATFMLAPIVGALSAYVGVVLVQSLANLDVLSKATFGSVWDHPDAPRTLAIAFVFGFLERLVDRFAGASAATLTPTKSSSLPAEPDASVSGD